MEGIIIAIIIGVISLIIFFFIKGCKNEKLIKKYINELNIKLYSFSKKPLQIIKEEDHVTCILFFINKYFLSGQINGMISLYDSEKFLPFLLIIEHCEPITSLFQLKDNSILSSSADGTMKKIKLINNYKKYLVEFVFYSNKEFIFKSIQLKNSDDILSCNISKELILWKKNIDKNPLYEIEKLLLNNEYVRDIFQINEKIFITSGETLQFWDIHNYKSFKKASYICKGNNSIYKINDEYTGVLLENDGDILLINNNELNEIKLFNLSKFSLTCLKLLSNNIIVVGIFDINNKISFINKYIIIKKNNNIELIKLKNEDIYIESNDFSYLNWQRINNIEQVNNYIILGFGGKENLKNIGKLMIF